MVLLFGKCSLDVGRRELHRGNDLVSIEPQVFDLLLYLIRHRERVVSKEELVEAVWGGRIVSGSTVNSRICLVRRAIGDSGEHQRVIQTFPRKGLRFVGDLRERAEFRAAQPAIHGQRSEPGWENRALDTERVPTQCVKTAIAVLPFANMSGDSDQDGFIDGVVDDIAVALSQFSGLSVIAPGRTAAFKGWTTDVKRVGYELGVPYVLQGSIRKADGRVRIAVEIVDTASGAYLWANRFDQRLDCILDVQDEVSAHVAGAIAPQLEQIEIERARHERADMHNPYHHYLRGIASVYRWTKHGVSEALKYFRRAVEIDSEFAPAYGMAAYCYVQRKSNGWITDLTRENSECAQLARQATEFGRNDSVALARAALAMNLISDADVGTAVIDHAVLLNPNLAAGWYVSGWTRLLLGEVDVAAEHLMRAIRLSPRDPLAFKMQAALAYAHFLSRRYDDASIVAQRAISVQPNYLTAMRAAAASHAMGGRLGEARKWTARMRKLDQKLCLAYLPEVTPFRRVDHFGRWRDALQKAGLPE